jgi:integrase
MDTRLLARPGGGMAGTMRQGRTPGSWELRVELARDPATGKRRWKSRTVYGSEKQASRELARLVVEVGGLDVAEMTGGTVNDLGKRWLKHLAARGRERSTLYNYKLHLDAIAPYLGDLPVVAVTGSRIDAAYDALLADGRGTGAINAIHRTLRAMFNQARKWKLCADNPAVDATPPAHRSPDAAAPSADAVRALLAHVRRTDLAMACYLRVSATLGTRRGETLALRWSDVHADAISIDRALSEVSDGKGITVKSTKTHAAGQVPADVSTLAQLVELRTARETLAASVGTTLPIDAFVFSADPAGATPWKPGTVTKRLARLRQQVPGAENITAKSLRAYVATVLVDGEVDYKSAQARLRHAQQSTTARHYTARRTAAEIRAAQVVADSLDR